MILCMGIIFFLSHQPGDSLDLPLPPGFDELSHMVAYGVLSWTVIICFSGEMRKARKWLVFGVALLVPILFGISDEYHQSYVAGRSSEFLDLVADGMGAVLASSFWLLKTSKI